VGQTGMIMINSIQLFTLIIDQKEDMLDNITTLSNLTTSL